MKYDELVEKLDQWYCHGDFDDESGYELLQDLTIQDFTGLYKACDKEPIKYRVVKEWLESIEEYYVDI